MSGTGGTVLALGGGGARGLAHLGVLEVLEEAGIRPDRIIGVSVGSVAGAVYCTEPGIEAARRRVLDYILSPAFQRTQLALYGGQKPANGGLVPGFSWLTRIKDYLRRNRLFHRVVTGPSVLPGRMLADVTANLVPARGIETCTPPLTVVAVDLRTGLPVRLEEGPLREAVRGSSSLPGIFPPVPLGEHLLCDIGVLCATPVSVARSYDPDLLIAVDVSPGLSPIDECETALEAVMRMQDIGGSMLQDRTISEADVVVRPRVAHVEWTDFSDPEGCIELGRVAARNALPRILQGPDHELPPSSRQAV